MTRSLMIMNYSPLMLDVAASFDKGVKRLEIPCEDEKQAAGRRLDYRGLVGAIRHEYNTARRAAEKEYSEWLNRQKRRALHTKQFEMENKDDPRPTRPQDIQPMFVNFTRVKMFVKGKKLLLVLPEETDSEVERRALAEALQQAVTTEEPQITGPTQANPPTPVEFNKDHSENAVERFLKGEFDPEKDK